MECGRFAVSCLCRFSPPVAIEPAARAYGLGFLALQPEHYDFLVPTARRGRPAVRRFLELLDDPTIVARLCEMGFSR